MCRDRPTRSPRTPRSRSRKAASPVRSCVGCRRHATPDALDRIVRAPDGGLRVGRAEPGRGAWICGGRPDCFERATRKGGLARALRRGLSTDDIRALRARLYGAPTDPAAPPTGGIGTE